ncbi:MAG: T9SS type A sorting domain-containing protein [Cytophagaceae bacterium]|nr:MAG: T9SS type A sorting domain-containing protein [Cytophagaceae bacterium]
MRHLLLATCLLGVLPAQAQTSLTKLGSVTVPGYGTELLVSGTTAYVFTAVAGAQYLRVYDVSTPASPQLLSTLALTNTANYPPLPPHHATLSNGVLYVSSYPQTSYNPHAGMIWAINVTNPASPVVYGSTNAASGDDLFVAASGDYAYAVVDNSNQLYVYSRNTYSNGNLMTVRTITLPYSVSGVIGLSVSGTTGYVQYANSVFATLDLTNPANPVSSPGTTAGTISATSGPLAYGLAQPNYLGSVPSNTLRFYSLATPAQPRLVRAQAGSYGTRVAAGGQSVFTVGATSPYQVAAATSSEPLRGYYSPTSGAAPVAAVTTDTQGANALAVANNVAYVLTDTELRIYAFPTTVTATRDAALAALPRYPNPAHGQLRLPQLALGAPVAIYDALGRVCLDTKLPASGTLDISALPTGLYHVRTASATSKLVVE